MKSFKLLLSALALVALAATPSLRAQDASSTTSSTSSSSQGQGHQGRHMDPTKEEAHFKAQIAKLTLTAAQQTTVNAAFADWEKQLTALQSATTKDQKQPIFKAIRTDRETIIGALTSDQKAQLHPGHGKKSQGSSSGSSSTSGSGATSGSSN